MHSVCLVKCLKKIVLYQMDVSGCVSQFVISHSLLHKVTILLILLGRNCSSNTARILYANYSLFLIIPSRREGEDRIPISGFITKLFVNQVGLEFNTRAQVLKLR